MSDSNNNLDLLFIGGLFPRELEKEIHSKSKGHVQSAANTFQWSLVRGFDALGNVSIKILNEMFLGSFPRQYRDAFVKETEFSHIPDAKDINLGFINVSGLKQFLSPFKEKKHLREWALSDNGAQKAVLIYSLNPRFIRIARYLKKINRDIFICITINDLPDFIMMGKISILKKIWKKVNSYRVKSNIDLIDGYVLITAQMADYLNIAHKPHTVVEALIDIGSESVEAYERADGLKTIVYTGTLTAKYGIMNLVEAFENIEDENYRLIICGGGETAELVRQRAEKDKRIKYMGILNAEQVKSIQKSCSLLVNPRQNNEEFTKYSFPIKTIEYLLSGVPVLCYKLDGMPDEYDEYLNYVENNSIEALTNALKRMCELTDYERKNIKKRNISFVVNNKNSVFQVKKITDMILNAKNQTLN